MLHSSYHLSITRFLYHFFITAIVYGSAANLSLQLFSMEEPDMLFDTKAFGLSVKQLRKSRCTI
jgi:hypothetical protein